MCGIAGVAATERGRGVSAMPSLDAMGAAMTHRGPDDRGVYRSDDGRVGFAHCRLAILDLSAAGHQPMRDAETWITFNGEIYNFAALRDELASRGHAFHSQSDTEVLLAGYREWGVDVVAHLDGMFAFAIHDGAQRRLFLARDRAGEKPLYYHHAGGRLTFASELKALIADPSFPRAIDGDALDLYLAYGYVPGDRSMFAGVHKLRPAEALLYDLDGDTLRRWTYWQLPHAPASAAPVDALVEEFEQTLEASVRRQLVADVPVGILLSGGLDSSLVTAMAARASQGKVKTFTVSFPGHAAHDESAHARIVAKHFDTDHTEIAAEPATLELMPELARQYDEPIADYAIIPTYLVARVIRQHATVALGGDGGDELFGGYPHYSWLMKQERYRRFVPRPLRALGSAAAARLLPVGVSGRNHLIGFRNGLGESMAHVNLLFDESARRRLLGRATHEPERYRATVADAGQSLLRRAMETDFRTTMVDGYLVKVDRASMLASLEIRAPFLDRAMIEFAYGRVPDSLKATESARKILPRLAARRLLPPELDLTRKQGFTPPLSQWLAGSWRTFVAETLTSSDVFDRAAVQSLLRGQDRGRQNEGRIFALLMFELWRREYRPSFSGESR
jgi:asparagine synthase (glutamine-hydrolysing)